MKEKTPSPQNLVLLTGIKPTGSLHLGNYFGSIRPYLDLKKTLTQKNASNKKNPSSLSLFHSRLSCLDLPLSLHFFKIKGTHL